MKPFIIFFVVSMFMFSCKEVDDSMSEYEISNIGFTKEDANRKISNTPTDIVFVQISDQTIKIDFSLDDIIREDIFCDLEYYYDNDKHVEGDLFKKFSTVGKLADYYNRSQLNYNYGYSNYRMASHFDGNIVYSKIEYALAQECFKDECSSMTRKAVLQMVIEKHEKKTIPYVISYSTIRTGLFLMAVILVKEENATFLDTIHKNPIFQKVLRLNLDEFDTLDFIYLTPQGKEINDVICQIAIEFLSH